MKTLALRSTLFLLSCLGLLCLVSTGVAQADNLFGGPINSPAGRYPWALTAGDFNGDGKIDVAVTNNYPVGGGRVQVLLGEGTGVFQDPVGYTVGETPFSIVTGDFNSDHKPDLAVTSLNGSRKKLGLLLGHGDGSFQSQVTYRAGSVPVQVAVGDFNGDGDLDLAVANAGGFLEMLLGNGGGTFQPKINNEDGIGPAHLAVGDLNGDGIPDVVTTDACKEKCAKFKTRALLGEGDGTFYKTWKNEEDGQQFGLALGDFNGDGKLDLASTDGRELGIRLGKGDGTFGERANYPVAAGVIAIADFDGDGKLDVAVTDGQGVSVLLGKGDGTFGSATNYALSSAAVAIEMVAVDVNGDKRPDLIVTDFFNQVVSVLLNTGHK